jgi:hypothetical protein
VPRCLSLSVGSISAILRRGINTSRRSYHIGFFIPSWVAPWRGGPRCTLSKHRTTTHASFQAPHPGRPFSIGNVPLTVDCTGGSGLYVLKSSVRRPSPTLGPVPRPAIARSLSPFGAANRGINNDYPGVVADLFLVLPRIHLLYQVVASRLGHSKTNPHIL